MLSLVKAYAPHYPTTANRVIAAAERPYRKGQKVRINGAPAIVIDVEETWQLAADYTRDDRCIGYSVWVRRTTGPDLTGRAERITTDRAGQSWTLTHS